MLTECSVDLQTRQAAQITKVLLLPTDVGNIDQKGSALVYR